MKIEGMFRRPGGWQEGRKSSRRQRNTADIEHSEEF